MVDWIADEQLGPVAAAAQQALTELGQRDAVDRMWGGDHTLWQDDPTEVADRLGWLHVLDESAAVLPDLDDAGDAARRSGLTDVVLMGMGGSSLFPDVLASTFGAAEGRLRLHVLDTTDPAAILRVQESLDLERCLFVAASKSGTTIETRSQLAHFWDATSGDGERFAAITDPGSELEALGRERRFRAVWLNRPDIGGRYSALSLFGMVPAALIGAPAATLLARARDVAAVTAAGRPPTGNPAARLAAALAGAVREGRDKLTLVLPDQVAAFGAWIEQLVAESTGKQGTGMLPVDGEPLGPPDVYGDDRLFVAHGSSGTGLVDDLASAGHPVVRLALDDLSDLGGLTLLWEQAVALAGSLLGINPFDQPDVAAAKQATSRVLDEGLPENRPQPAGPLLEQLRSGDHLAVQAFVDPGDADLVGALQRARTAVRDAKKVATTLGLGPRYLHSTGQLHKGGPPTGVFVQVVGDDPRDVAIPGQPYGFSMLKQAQAAGDLEALRERGLRCGRVTADDLAAAAERLVREGVR